MQVSKRLLLACLTMESLLVFPAFAADKVSLFKVVTAKDEIVIVDIAKPSRFQTAGATSE